MSAEPHCTTCADAATPMRVLELDAARALAVCSDEHGRRHSVDVGLVEPVATGDTLLVHAGTALHRQVAGAPAPGAPKRASQANAPAAGART